MISCDIESLVYVIFGAALGEGLILSFLIILQEALIIRHNRKWSVQKEECEDLIKVIGGFNK